MNIRDQPNGGAQYVARAGEQLYLTGVYQDIDGVRWYELVGGTWVQGQYVRFE